MEYPDAKRSIRLCLGAMHLLRVTTNGLECAAIAQRMLRICCHKTWEHRSAGFDTVGGTLWDDGQPLPRGRPGFVSLVLREPPQVTPVREGK